MAEHKEATADGRSSRFNPEKPWDSCFLALIADRDWWHNQLEAKAIVQKVDRLGEDAFVDGDFVTSKPLKRQRADPKGAGGGAGGAPPKKQPKQKEDAAAQQPMPKQDLSQKVQGRFTLNRRGNPICQQFNAGQCGTPSHQQCQHGSHQCNHCLQPGHGATTCGKGQAKGGGGGKGKGKGQGKGKGKQGEKAPWH